MEEQTKPPVEEINETLATEPEPVVTQPEPEKAKPSGMSQFSRWLLITVAVIGLSFLAGFLTDHFARFLPVQAELERVSSELMQANQTIGELEPLKQQVETLSADLATTEAHLALMQVIEDVNTAQLALTKDDVAGAKVALKATMERLQNLSPVIAEFDTKLAESMPQRLELIIAGLDGDVEVAKIDLDVLAKNLLDVETALFGK